MRILAFLAAVLLPGLATAQLSCSSVTCGTSCGPTLTVTFTPTGQAGNMRLEMEGTGLHADALSVLYWGDNSQYIGLPGGCALLINPIWGTFHTTSSLGTLSWGRSWPHWARALFYMQMGSIGMDGGVMTIRSTDCQLAGCL